MMCKVLQDTRFDVLCIVTTVGQYNALRLGEGLYILHSGKDD